jgi:hypothetical protein
MRTDNFTARKAVDDAGAEISAAILEFREGNVSFQELVSLVSFHIPGVTAADVEAGIETQRRFDA